jgi:uncharacterized protein (DUF3084 family)
MGCGRGYGLRTGLWVACRDVQLHVSTCNETITKRNETITKRNETITKRNETITKRNETTIKRNETIAILHWFNGHSH